MERHVLHIVLVMAMFIAGCAPSPKYDSAQQSHQGADPSQNPSDQKSPSMTDQLQNLADQMVGSLRDKKKSKIAVVEFTDSSGRVSEFGVFLAEEMITRLFQSGNFEVVERSQLNKVLAEHELNLSGLVDESTAIQLGELLGADAIATGTISDLRDSARINSRLISTESGSVFAAAAISVEKDQRVADMMGKFPSQSQPSRGHSSSVTNSPNGIEKIILSSSANNTHVWKRGAPYLTTHKVFVDDVAFISTGNNHFLKDLGKVGYESGEYRYLSMHVYLLKPEAGMVLQVFIGRKWNHRWGMDGRSSYKGYVERGYSFRGQNVSIPTGKWVEIKLDLIEDLGGKPGQTLDGLAFSGNDGNLIYDRVTLIANSK